MERNALLIQPMEDPADERLRPPLDETADHNQVQTVFVDGHGLVRALDRVITEVYNVLDNIPTTIILILISYIMRPGIGTLTVAMLSAVIEPASTARKAATSERPTYFMVTHPQAACRQAPNDHTKMAQR